MSTNSAEEFKAQLIAQEPRVELFDPHNCFEEAPLLRGYLEDVIDGFYERLASAMASGELASALTAHMKRRKVAQILYEKIYNYHRYAHGAVLASMIPSDMLQQIGELAVPVYSHPFPSFYGQMVNYGFVHADRVDVSGYVQMLKGGVNAKNAAFAKALEAQGLPFEFIPFVSPEDEGPTRIPDFVTACFVASCWDAQAVATSGLNVVRARQDGLDPWPDDQRFLEYSPLVAHSQMLADGQAFLSFGRANS